MAAIVRAGSGYKASSASGAQVIDGSLKFDKAKEQYLTRTPGSDGDKETFTWSVWVKRDVFGTEGSADADHNPVFCAGNSGSASTDWRFQNSSSSNDDEFWWINWDGGSTYFSVESTPRYKDVGGFYHIVGTYDEGKATVYINGTPVTALNSNTQNGGTSKINSTSAHSIGCFGQGTLSWFGGNMSQFYLLDGLSVGPSYFGYTDQLTNVWRPKKFLAEGTTVNNGTVWSSTADTPDSGSAADFFDGDLTDTAYWTSVATDHTLTTGPFTINNSLRVYGNLNPNNNRFKINGLYTPYLTPDLGSSWYVIPLTQHTLPITVTSLQQNFASASGISIAAIEVDGVIMKDSTTQNLAYGTNGCYLPFDGNTPIGQDRSGKGNDWTPVNFACSAPLNQATGALPILDTVSGGKVATSGVRTDTYSNSCVFALPLVGIATDVSNRVNSGSTAKVVTTSGAVASSVYSNFYGGSYYFDESNDYITTPDSTEFDFGTGDFTVELWIYLDDQSSSNPVIVGAVGGWYIQLKSSDTQIEFYTGSTSINTGTIPTIKTGIWHHIAACRTGSTIQIFLDGEEVTSASNSDTTDLAAALYVGSYGGASLFFGGYIQDVRVYKGVGKYTSSFVAASTNPAILPDTPSGVSQSSKLTKVTAGALSFSGNSGGANGDHLNLVSTSDFDFGTGDFTIELWANCGGYGSSPYLFDFRTDGSDTGTTNKIVWYVPSSTGKPTFWTNGSSRIVAEDTITLDAWVHLALVRSSGTTTMYIDGSAQSSTYSDTTDYGDGGSPVTIGQRQGTASQSWDGFLSNVRIVKGTAVYTADFAPPTSPLTNITNTKLLCCQSISSVFAADVVPDAGSGTALLNAPLSSTPFADSSSTSATITNTGSITTASAGTNSFDITNAASLDGSTQRLSTNNTNMSFINNWTLDIWFKLDGSASGYNALVNTGYGAATGPYMYFGLDDDEKPYVENGSAGGRTTAFAALNKDQWYQMRVTSNGASIRQYIDGELVVTHGVNTTDMSTEGTKTIGSLLDNGNNANNFHGLIGPVRYVSSYLGPPIPGGESTSSGALSNTPDLADIISNGTVIPVTCNPFDTDIHTVLGKSTDYPTLNPLARSQPITSGGGAGTAVVALTDGNLTATNSVTADYNMNVTSTLGMTSGKFYCEYLHTYSSTGNGLIGIAPASFLHGHYAGSSGGSDPNTENAYGMYMYNRGILHSNSYNLNGVASNTSYSRVAQYSTVGIALDMDNYKCWWSVDGVWLPYPSSYVYNPDPATGTEPHASGFDSYGDTWYFCWTTAGGESGTFNFGQKPFKYTPPEGFGPLNGANLQRPGGVRPDQYVGVTTYTGTGDGTTYNNASLKFAADMTWFKRFDGSVNHVLYDSVRGYGNATYALRPNTNDDQDAFGDAVVNINTNGFSVTGSNTTGINGSGEKIVCWAWKAGGSEGTWNKDGKAYASAAAAGLDNTSGGSTGTDSKFAVLRYTGTGSEITMGHSLGTTPACAIHKCVSHSGDWTVWHDGLDSLSKILILNSTGSQGNMSSGITSWNSTQLVMDTDGGVNSSGRDYMLYLWANIPGVQKFGWYEGNNNTDGAFVWVGFEPAVIIIKIVDASANWMIYDTSRDFMNTGYRCLYPNLTNAENSTSSDNEIDILSDGFKLRNNDAQSNQDNKYIYMAWAKSPLHNLYGAQSNTR